MSFFEIKAIGYGLLVPAVVTGLIAFIVLRCCGERPRACRALGVLAMAASYLLAYVLLGIAPLAPQNCEHWMPYAVLLALLVGLLESMMPNRSAARRLIVALAVAVFLIPTGSGWVDVVKVPQWWIIVLAFIVFESWNLLDALVKRIPDATLPIVLLAAAIGGTVVLFWSGSAKFAQAFAILIAILGVVALLSFWRTNAELLRGILPALAVLFPGWMMVGWVYTFSSVPYWSFLLIPLAPFVLCLAMIPLPQVIPPQYSRWFAGALAIAAIVIAVALAVNAENSADPEEEDWGTAPHTVPIHVASI